MPDIVPLVDEGLGNSSYVVDVGDGRALVLDPQRDPAPYRATAERLGLEPAFAVETHLHADFVSGTRELAATGAQVVAPAASRLEFPVTGLADGDELDLGGLTLRALATPGHTPEHLAYLLLDGRRPVALFSGGSLLAGGVARTDLIDPDQTEDLARRLWRSLQERVLSLPDDLPVHPTHGGGSFCSTGAGGERTTTIGREKAANPLLAAPDEDVFVKELLAGYGTYPPYFLRLRAVNRRGPRVFGATPPLPSLTATDAERLRGEGAWIVDARPVAGFAAAHVAGSVSVPLRAQFATWLGWVVPPDRPLVFVLGPGQDRTDLVRQTLNIGYEDIAGELEGGVEAWTAAGLPVEATPLRPAAELSGLVLDVRQDAEFRAGHVPGAVHVELGALTDRLADVPPAPLAVMCGHGERAMTAASLLARAGRAGVTVAVGGPPEWEAAHGSLEAGG